MAFGEILKAAREQRGLSLSSVAESTHMKVQVIEDLEREDFRRIAAPIYGRGFVKLYAEFLELDPAPLIREFMDAYTGKKPPVVGRRQVEATPPDLPPSEVATPITRTVSDAALQRHEALPRPSVRPIETEEAPPPAQPVRAGFAPTKAWSPPPAPDRDESENEPEPEQPVPPPADRPDVLVLEPERHFHGLTGDPDLFTPAPTPTASARKAMKKPRGPIFDMGKHLDTSPVSEAEADSDPSTPRHHARVNAFLEGVKRLKTTALGDGTLTANAKHKSLFLIAGAALLVFVLVGFGLLKLTAKRTPSEHAPRIFETIAPIPDFYVN